MKQRVFLTLMLMLLSGAIIDHQAGNRSAWVIEWTLGVLMGVAYVITD